MNRYEFALATTQGIYFLLTGVWPLVHIRSFQTVTGPKTDLWLVRTVGVLVAVVALTLLVAAWRRDSSPELRLLAIGSGTALMAIDVIHVVRRVIAPIYLVDAAFELALIALWIAVLAHG